MGRRRAPVRAVYFGGNAVSGGNVMDREEITRTLQLTLISSLGFSRQKIALKL